MLKFTSIVEEKEMSAQEVTNVLIQEKQKIKLAFEKLNTLRDERVQHQKLIVKKNKELDVIKGNMVVASKEIELYEEQINKLHQNLEQ